MIEKILVSETNVQETLNDFLRPGEVFNLHICSQSLFKAWHKSRYFEKKVVALLSNLDTLDGKYFQKVLA